ncbi:pyridoxal phosphate-dependent aminotransferase [Methylocystis sp. IM3]|uniref:pyridoxal phosphate-dependent aminotransferase n=1 Tax=unclassified Methylocystis TaxID=2625913 RepID=UPI000FA12D53|nr:MAG: pyridoxal phosphate-dependent aminotransferase [Hyphomicrobiales bacterium]
MHDSRRLQAVTTPIIPVIADLIRANPGTISLGQGVVNYAPPPEAAAGIARFLAEPENNKYQGASGLPALLEALSEKLATENGVAVGPGHGNRLMVTAGGNQAFFNVALAILDPGDEVILPVPYYFNHEMAIVMANARPVLVATDRNHQLDIEAIRAAITPRTRAIVTVSPNNPTGAVYPADALREVNALCAERGLFHVSDEAYEYFTYDGAKPFSPASIDGAAAHTISLYSMSKAYGFASWRIGWMAFPETLEPALRKIQDTVIICPPVVSQYAALGALRAGRAFVQAQVEELAQTRAKVKRELSRLAEDGLAEVPDAAGALYFLLRLKSDLAPLDYATRLIREHRVAVIPGDAFGLTQGCHLRVAYGALQPATATEGVGRLVMGVRALAG